MDFKGIWEKYKEQRVGDITTSVTLTNCSTCGTVVPVDDECYQCSMKHAAPKNPILGACPICTKQVHEDEPHIGPYGSQLHGYQYAHADCAYPKPVQRQPQAVCVNCGALLEENDGVWWTFNTCRSWCDKAVEGTQHLPAFTLGGVLKASEPAPEQHATKGRGKSSAARKVFGG